MPNLHNRYKSAEFPCSCSKNLSSFRFIIKQQWTTEEISVFSNSSHLEWGEGLSDTILKGTHPARLGLIWFRGFRGEDLNVKVYDIRRRTPSDGKSSHGLWPGELKMNYEILKETHIQTLPPFKMAAVTKNRNFFSFLAALL
jgi:hypothetical protein